MIRFNELIRDYSTIGGHPLKGLSLQNDGGQATIRDCLSDQINMLKRKEINAK